MSSHELSISVTPILEECDGIALKADLLFTLMKLGATRMMERPEHESKKIKLAAEELLGDHKGQLNLLAFIVLTIYYNNSKPSGKGERLIVLHAGGKDGWIPGKQYVRICIMHCFLLKVVIGSLNLRKGLQTTMRK